MFLVGIFAPSNHTTLSDTTLETTANVIDGASLSSVARDNLYDLVVAGLERGAWLNTVQDVEKYAWGIKRNSERSDYSKKVRRKEYSLVSRESKDEALQLGTVDEDTLTSEMSLVEQPSISWLTLINKETVEALDFRDEIQDLIDSYNNICDYYESTYGFDFKQVLSKALRGVVESERYLVNILESENDAEFIASFFELAKYEEFYDFLHSDERVLRIDGVSK